MSRPAGIGLTRPRIPPRGQIGLGKGAILRILRREAGEPSGEIAAAQRLVQRRSCVEAGAGHAIGRTQPAWIEPAGRQRPGISERSTGARHVARGRGVGGADRLQPGTGVEAMARRFAERALQRRRILLAPGRLPVARLVEAPLRHVVGGLAQRLGVDGGRALAGGVGGLATGHDERGGGRAILATDTPQVRGYFRPAERLRRTPDPSPAAARQGLSLFSLSELCRLA